jgi:hypothetical protein
MSKRRNLRNRAEPFMDGLLTVPEPVIAVSGIGGLRDYGATSFENLVIPRGSKRKSLGMAKLPCTQFIDRSGA